MDTVPYGVRTNTRLNKQDQGLFATEVVRSLQKSWIVNGSWMLRILPMSRTEGSWHRREFRLPTATDAGWVAVRRAYQAAPPARVTQELEPK